MKYTIIAAAMLFGTTAMAQDAVTVAVEPTATVDTSTAEAQFNAVCSGTFVLSTDLQTACAADEMPKLLKDGSRFRNTGIGAEINTLARQL